MLLCRCCWCCDATHLVKPCGKILITSDWPWGKDFEIRQDPTDFWNPKSELLFFRSEDKYHLWWGIISRLLLGNLSFHHGLPAQRPPKLHHHPYQMNHRQGDRSILRITILQSQNLQRRCQSDHWNQREQSHLGRPIKINYAPNKSGQENDWPPKQKVITGG